MIRVRGDLSKELTKREREVLEGVSQGETNRAIAQRLGIKEGTIKTHVYNAYTKLRVHNRVHAALVCLGDLTKN